MVLAHDVRYALRLHQRTPLFTLAAVLTLAIAIGAAASVFSVIDAVLIRPLPYPDPSRLVFIRADVQGHARQAQLSAPELQDLRRATLFTGLAGIVPVEASLTDGDSLEAATAVSVLPEFLPLLGITPALGRQLRASDIGPQSVTGVLISHDVWQRRYHGDPAVIGHHIQANNLDVEVVGVLPASFRLHLGPGANVDRNVDVWFPHSLEGSRTDRSLLVIGRLKETATVEQASAEMDAMAERLRERYPASYPDGLRLHVSRLHDDLVTDVRPALAALAGAVLFVLVIACANVANLLLARAAVRQRELAIRHAVGASTFRLVQQMLIESVVLGIPSALLGLLLARGLIDALLALGPGGLPRPGDITLDARVTLFSLGVAIVTSVVFGLAPALAVRIPTLGEALKSGGRGDAGDVGRAARRGLLVAQVALSIVLVTGAGLLIRTFVSLQRVDLGFDDRAVLTANVSMSARAFRETGARLAIFETALARVRELPGVVAASAVTSVPLSASRNSDTYAAAPGQPPSHAAIGVALPGYFAVAGIRIVSGRDFDANDTALKRPVVIVDTMVAAREWPGRDPIGQTLVYRPGSSQPRTLTVVGLVRHVRIDGPRTDGAPQLYVPFHVLPFSALDFVVKTAVDPQTLGPAMEKAIESIAGMRPVRRVRPLRAYVDEHLADSRFALFLIGVLAAVALVLSAAGVYGAVAYVAARRRKEIAVRVALGAGAGAVFETAIREAVIVSGAGIVIGIAGAGIVTGQLRPLLYAVTPFDPLTYAAGGFVVLVLTLLAASGPARRALRVDPISALRQD